MMLSAPDTAFGRALGQFMLLFTRRPLPIQQLHKAYASLTELAAREQPALPWPLEVREEDGERYPLTVEGILSRKSQRHARLPVVGEATITEALRAWHGARVKVVCTTPSTGTGFRLQLLKKTHPKVQAELGICCHWTLAQENPCSSDDAEELVALCLALLQGAKLLVSHLHPEGTLKLTFDNASVLEIRPANIVIGPDYFLMLENRIYYRFAGQFVASLEEE